MQPYEPSATDKTKVRAQTNEAESVASASRPLRAWPVWLIAMASLWCLFGPTLIGAPDSIRFGTLALGAFGQCIAMLGWVLFGSRVRWKSRFIMLGLGLAVVICAFAFQDKTIGISILLYGIPVAILCLAFTLLVTIPIAWPKRRLFAFASWALPILAWLLFRSEGYMASFMPQLRTRWSVNSEQLAERALKDNLKQTNTTALPKQVSLQSGDWPRFRGIANDGQTTEETFVASEKLKAKELWRKLSGPSWGSIIIVNGLLFTLEQRGKNEVVVCMDAQTGTEIWAYEHPARFEDTTSVSGVGPRGTPTFHNGRIYSVGALGNVVALNANDGTRIWERDLLTDTSGNVPMWGISTSPYLIDDVCYVLSNSDSAQGTSTIAYSATTGEILQNMGLSGSTYSSIQMLSLNGVQHILSSVSKQQGDGAGQKLIGFDRASNKELWRFEGKGTGNSMLTPIAAGPNQILIVDGSEGATMIEVKCDGKSDDASSASWTANKLWSENKMLPEFSDIVFQNGLVLGISKNILTALDAETGKLLWKKLRFGGGQLIGLAKQNAILAISESGELSLVKIDKSGPSVLLKWPALKEKTWNHPVVVGNRVYCRNAEEIVAFELSE